MSAELTVDAAATQLQADVHYQAMTLTVRATTLTASAALYHNSLGSDSDYAEDYFAEDYA